MLIRRFFAFVVSLFILFSLPLNAANAAGGWTPTGATSSGSRTIVSATKGGLKSAVNLAPSVIAVTAKLMRVANLAAIAYAAAQLVDDGTDYVLDPANNRVKYKPAGVYMYTFNNGVVDFKSPTLDGICSMLGATLGAVVNPNKPHAGTLCNFKYPNGSTGARSVNYTKVQLPEAYLSYSDITNQAIKNAAAGHAPSQKILAEAAMEQVAAGEYDKDLLAGAVPINDSRPVIPAVPGSQTGAPDEGISGATPGETAENARVEAERNKKAAQAAADSAKAAAEAARQAADDAQDIINSAVDEAIKEAARQSAETAAQAAADAKAVADRAAQAAAETAAQADRAAQAAVADAKALLDAAKAAADATAESIAAAQAKVDAAVKAAEAAAKEAAKAKEEAAKPFELPPFCSWAAPVCDFIDWFKEPPPADLPAGDVPFATTGDVGLDDVDRFEKRIEFSGQCPVNDFSFTMMGVTYAKPIPYYHLCGFLEQIAPWLLAMCYLGVAYFVVENI